MFDAAQEIVGVAQVIRRLLSTLLEPGQIVDRGERHRRSQIDLAAAPDQLLGLGEEFDLANAAAAELDVVAFGDPGRAAAPAVDLAFDRVNILDRRIIQAFPPDERAEAVEKRLAGGDVAGDRARLDHRRALPILAEALVIGLGGQHRERQRRRAGVRSESEIGAEDVAIGGPLLHQPDQIPGQANEMILQTGAVIGFDPVRIE